MATVLIAGGTGLIGKRLSFLLSEKGYTVIHLSRKENLKAQYPAYAWDINAQTISEEAIQQADYVINLAGAGVADRHWTKARKQLIIDSRVNGNALLQKAFSTIKKPKKFIASAAIGFYGDRGNEVLTEDSSAGDKGFLAESCVLWEQSIHDLASSTTIPTAIIRIGIVLSTQGGALEKMLLSFNIRTGAYFGDGSAIYSWIHIDDVCRMFIHAIEKEEVVGIYNGVGPQALPNKDIVYAIPKAKNQKAIILPAPAFGLRLAMGEMADAVLTSTHVSSKKMEATGFNFQFPEIVEALKDLINRKI